MADLYAAPGAIARAAGDLHIHLLKKVEPRRAPAEFYELGRKCRELVGQYGY